MAKKVWRVVVERLHFAAPHIDGFRIWLHGRGYSARSVRNMGSLLAGWTDWAFTAGFDIDSIRAGFAASEMVVHDERRIKEPGNIDQASLGAARLLIRYLQDQAVIPGLILPPRPVETWPILGTFRSWMRQHRGVAETSLDTWQWIIIKFLEEFGEDPSELTAEAVRGFVLRRAKQHSPSRARSVGAAVRAFLRFLVAVGRCPDGLQFAVPRFANWQLASIPKHLSAEEVERAISVCEGESRLRDKAVILLLARLGLRASDVANLHFQDFDWRNGRVAVSGKSRRAEWLPLTQEIGDAVLHYLERGRPSLSTSNLFLTAIAPIKPLTRITVKCIVSRALKRAGIECACKGAHVLRHSAATAMLRQGVSLAGVGAVLRHRSLATTMHYAKVDVGALSEIAQPWPGRLPC